ncbi:dephospho-CoA kinase [Pseudothermotoga thermarum]|uniref:Dephospho-CoA kinase n=1 Tax=Pseudothermotoga thermarum DSM 5069 TaxID=688269 RepID=F7YVD1_9THEM|nr:dephospho-CoA kinase [Pseudothermotoga thermarum]AEH50434.1 dephospho-CoA kinase [Pseudothermotoga thermarum DSM 5069]
MRFVVGVTGKIGSGKSTVSKFLAKLGATVIDVDKVAHEILETENVKRQIVEAFGKEILTDGKVNRKKLAGVVFSDSLKLRLLESIVHPVLREEIARRVEKLRGLVVLDAAILHRIGLDKLCDLIIVVTAPLDRIFERLRAKGLSEGEIRRRLSFQNDIPLEGIVVDNEGDLNSLREKVEKIYQQILLPRIFSKQGGVF